jgi:hypothetical protein
MANRLAHAFNRKINNIPGVVSPSERTLVFTIFFDAPLGRNREGHTDEDTETLSLAIIVFIPVGLLK